MSEFAIWSYLHTSNLDEVSNGPWVRSHLVCKSSSNFTHWSLEGTHAPFMLAASRDNASDRDVIGARWLHFECVVDY